MKLAVVKFLSFFFLIDEVKACWQNSLNAALTSVKQQFTSVFQDNFSGESAVAQLIAFFYRILTKIPNIDSS